MRTGGVRYGKELDTLSYILHHIVGKVRHKTNPVKQKGLVTKYINVKYEGPKSYQSRDTANVKVFADKQTNKRTDKIYMSPIYRCGGIFERHFRGGIS